MEQSHLDYEADGFEINIEVGTPEQKSEMVGANKFYIYPIKGEDKHGAIDMIRRYSDFVNLRNALVARWPGCFITSLPEKKFLGNNQGLFVENRRKGLEDFLTIISAIAHLWYSEEMQLFLKTNSSDLEKQIASLVSRTNHLELTTRYERHFKAFEGIELKSELNNKILQFSMYLKQVTPMLDNLINISETMQAAKKKQSEKYLMVIDFMLPEYEKTCIGEYLPENRSRDDYLIFANAKDNQSLADAQQALKEALPKQEAHIICEGLKKQRREIMSFLDTIRVRDEFQASKQRATGKVKDCEIERQKIQSGKSSVLAKIRSLSQEHQLETNRREMDDAMQEEKHYTFIINMVNIILAHIEIGKFKKLREKTYYSLLKRSAVSEKEHDKKLNAFWRAVGDHDLVGAGKVMKRQSKDIGNEVKEEEMMQKVQEDQYARQQALTGIEHAKVELEKEATKKEEEEEVQQEEQQEQQQEEQQKQSQPAQGSPSEQQPQKSLQPDQQQIEDNDDQ